MQIPREIVPKDLRCPAVGSTELLEKALEAARGDVCRLAVTVDRSAKKALFFQPMEPEQGKTPRRTSWEKVFQSRTFALFRETFEKEGSQVTVDLVRHRGAAGVLPLSGEEVVLERQFRYSLGKWVLEVPAGTLEEGEDEETCARRELTEETGYVASRLVRMGRIAPTPGYDDEMIGLYAAWVSGPPGTQSLDQDEQIEVLRLGKQEALEMIRRGEIFDGKTVVAILLARELGYL